MTNRPIVVAVLPPRIAENGLHDLNNIDSELIIYTHAFYLYRKWINLTVSVAEPAHWLALNHLDDRTLRFQRGDNAV